MERVGALLGSLEGNDPLRRRLAEARALESWPEIVGPHLAKLTRPLRIAGGRLFVVAHGSALRQELVFHRGDILRKVNRAAGGPVARELIFLESDASLSSLVETEETPASPTRAAPGEEKATEAPEAAPTDDETDEPTEPYVPIVPPFDAAAWRGELDRIAKETPKGSRRSGSGGNPEEWERK